MTTIALEGNNYLDIEDWKGGKNPVPVKDVVIIDSKTILDDPEGCIERVREWQRLINK